MILSSASVAQIKAAQGIYRAADVARAYHVHRSTVCRIWKGQTHSNLSPAVDFPDIPARPSRQDLAEDVRILSSRGLSPADIASQLDIGVSTVYALKGVYV